MIRALVIVAIAGFLMSVACISGPWRSAAGMRSPAAPCPGAGTGRLVLIISACGATMRTTAARGTSVILSEES